jgi:hypothetical protein
MNAVGMRRVWVIAVCVLALHAAGCQRKKGAHEGSDEGDLLDFFGSDDDPATEQSESRGAESGEVQVWPRATLSTSESGAQASFNMKLSRRPTSEVTVQVSSSRPQEGVVSPSTLVFSPANWNVAQVVTVSGVDDDVPDGSQKFLVVIAPAVSADPAYSNVDAKDVQAINADNDQGGIFVEPAGGIVTSEDGQSATLSLRLPSRPKFDVRVEVISSRVTEAKVTPATVVWGPSTWNLPQTVTVTGVDDNVVDGDVKYQVTFRPTQSEDRTFDGLSLPPVGATNLDNDRAGVMVEPTGGLVTTEAGGQATFTVRLTAQPTAAATIVMRSSAPHLSRVSPSSIVFSESNWNRPQLVTLTGLDDGNISGTQSYTVVLEPIRTSDTAFRSIDPPDVSVTSQEQLPGSVIFNPSQGTWDQTPKRGAR